MTPRAPSARKISLPRLDPAQAQARSLLAQRLRSLAVPWSGQHWVLSLTPSAEPGPLCAGETEWYLQAMWAGVPIDLILPAGLVHAWLRAQCADLDVSEVPEPLAAVLMEEACETMATSLDTLDLGPVRIDRLARGPREGGPMEHAFDVRAACAEIVLVGRLAVGSLGLSLLARLAANQPLVPNDLPSDQLPLAWRAQAGCTWLAAHEVGRLSIGDTVLLEDTALQDDGQLWLACGAYRLRVALQGYSLVVKGALNEGGSTMQADDDQVAVPAEPDSVDHLPLRVVFDLGELTLTLGAVRELQAGQSIDLGQPLSSAVRIRVNGVLIGTGELVDIDGRMGVTVTALARRRQADAPRITPAREPLPEPGSCIGHRVAMNIPDPVTLLLVFTLLGLLPTLVVVTTCFLKISIVMMLLRNAMGVQQIPPNIALYGLSLILTAYVMAPVGNRIYETTVQPGNLRSVPGVIEGVRRGAEPLRDFMLRNSRPEQREFFVRTSQRMWGPAMSADVKPTDFLILMPAFLVSELTAAFQIGFLIYLPFLVIDLIISNILLAMGMMMVSPVTISLPLKLFLFIAADGWNRLIQGLVLTYT